MRLTSHFHVEEFTRSEVARRSSIDNTPSAAVVNNLLTLCREVLEPLRTHTGCPVIISSGYRSPALNRAVHGSATSQHLTGEAADLAIPDERTGREWFEWIATHLSFDQLIWEKATATSSRHWIHVSFRSHGQQRGMVIRHLVRD